MPGDATATRLAHLLALKAVAPFSALPPEDLTLLVERATPRAFDAGQTVVAEGIPLAAVHLVLSGRLEETRSGRRWAVREPYELVGGVDALGHAGEQLVVRATGPTRTLELDRDALLAVCLERFDVLATVASGVAAMGIAARRRLGPTAGFAPPAGAAQPADTPADVVLRLHRVAALREVPVHTLVHAVAAGDVVPFERGQPLWDAGEPADHLVLVLDGRVDCASADGAQRFALGPDDAVGALDALAGMPRWYGAAATTRVTGLRLPTAALLDVLEDDPDTAVDALVALARSIAHLIDRAARAPAGV